LPDGAITLKYFANLMIMKVISFCS